MSRFDPTFCSFSGQDVDAVLIYLLYRYTPFSRTTQDHAEHCLSPSVQLQLNALAALIDQDNGKGVEAVNIALIGESNNELTMQNTSACKKDRKGEGGPVGMWGSHLCLLLQHQ